MYEYELEKFQKIHQHFYYISSSMFSIRFPDFSFVPQYLINIYVCVCIKWLILKDDDDDQNRYKCNEFTKLHQSESINLKHLDGKLLQFQRD